MDKRVEIESDSYKPVILVVEDDKGLNYLICKILRKNGYKTEGLFDGKSAIERINKDQDIILLLDYKLPDMEGKKVIIDSVLNMYEFPFIIMTGHGDEKIAVDMMKMGARDYIVKDTNFIDFLPELINKTVSDARKERDYRLMKEELKQEEKKFTSLFNHGPDMLFTVCAETDKILDLNKVACTSLGYSAEELKGKPILDIYDKSSRSKAKECLDEFRKTGRIKPATLLVKSANKDKIYVELKAQAVKNKDGKITHSISSLRDISLRIEAEMKIKNLNEELEKKVEERTRELMLANEDLKSFSYSVSHDMRAPLTRIRGFSKALEENYENILDEKGRHYLNRIQNSCKSMAELIDGMLSLAQISRSDFNLKEINISEMSENIIEGLEEDFHSNRHNIIINPGIIIKGDSNLIKIMLTNLIENAIKFTSNEEEPQIKIGKAENEIFIKDNGEGFDMKYADDLMKPFSRLQDNEHPGTGIGLATVKRIIDRHGGGIRFESAKGKGTTVFINLTNNEDENETGTDS